MLPDKKIIAFDLDGTLAVSKSPITKDMAELIKKLGQKRIVVIISGGSFKQFKTQLLPPFEDGGTDSSVLKNLVLLPTSGSQRYEYDEQKKEWVRTDYEPLSDAIKEKARKLFEEIISSGVYDISKNPKGEILEDRGTQLSFSALGQLAPIEEKEKWDSDQKKRQKMRAFLEPKIPEATFAIGGTTTIDVLAKGFDKAVGLGRFLKKEGLEKSNLLFVGDGIFPGGNDYSVFEAGMETVAVVNEKETEDLIRKWLN